MNSDPADRLLAAASKNKVDTIRSLVTEKHVDPSHSNAVGQSALHIACLWGYPESVKALIELGANVKAKNTMTGASPLHMVAQSRKGLVNVEERIQIVECLVAAGAAKDQLDNLGNLPMDSMMLANNEEYRALREALQPNAPAIIQILENRDAASLEKLLVQDENASMASIEYMGKTPVMIVVDAMLTAVEELNNGDGDRALNCLRVLLNSVATTDAISASNELESNETPIHRLVQAVRGVMNEENDDIQEAMLCDAVDLFLKAGAEVDLDTKLLLHQAARRNELTFAKFCVKKLGLDPNTKGRQGMTPLIFAARSGQLEMVEFLLSQPNIDVTITNDLGQTALQAAQVNNRSQVVEALEKFTANNNSE